MIHSPARHAAGHEQPLRRYYTITLCNDFPTLTFNAFQCEMANELETIV